LPGRDSVNDRREIQTHKISDSPQHRFGIFQQILKPYALVSVFPQGCAERPGQSIRQNPPNRRSRTEQTLFFPMSLRRPVGPFLNDRLKYVTPIPYQMEYPHIETCNVTKGPKPPG
jgi:hypothetical protein